MVRAIVAVDSNLGIANDNGIPWDLPSDKAYFRSKTEGGTIIMGTGFYNELEEPLPNRQNIVASSDLQLVKPGFVLTHDARQFIQNFDGDIWVSGGAMLYESTLDLVEELYITRLKGDFSCTKFFPAFEDKFKLVSEERPKTENRITFTFQVWKRQ
jgi:dihydrofolate reductase